MSDMTTKLGNGEHPSHIELIDYVIQLQLSKIENYNNAQKLASSKISEYSESAMSNLIDLLELRLQALSENSEGTTEVI